MCALLTKSTQTFCQKHLIQHSKYKLLLFCLIVTVYSIVINLFVRSVPGAWPLFLYTDANFVAWIDLGFHNSL